MQPFCAGSVPRLWAIDRQLLLLQILLQDSLPQTALARFALLAGIFVEVPLCAFASLRFLSAFSFAGCMSTVAVMALVVALPLVDPKRGSLQEPAEQHWVSPGLVPATGIFAVCLSRVGCI
jgi:hypothetical protein